MNAPSCITKRLHLRSYHAGLVADQHIGWLNDPEVVKFSEQRHKEHTLESQHSYLNDLWRNPGSCIWLISLSANGRKQIGTITAHTDRPNKVSDMGIMIGEKSEWEQGYGLEAWQAVMGMLRAQGVRKLEAGCMESNLGMRALAAKAGFKFESRRDGHFLLNGKPETLYQFGWTP